LGTTPVIALDVKTCGDARPAAFTKDIMNLHYDLQAAFYMEGVRRFMGEEGTFIFVSVEADAPHATAYYALSPRHDLMLNGAKKYRHALNLYAKCKASGNWPAYEYGRVIEPQMLPWMAFDAT